MVYPTLYVVVHRVEIWRCEAEVVDGRLLFNHYQEKSPSSVHLETLILMLRVVQVGDIAEDYCA